MAHAASLLDLSELFICDYIYAYISLQRTKKDQQAPGLGTSQLVRGM